MNPLRSGHACWRSPPAASTAARARLARARDAGRRRLPAASRCCRRTAIASRAPGRSTRPARSRATACAPRRRCSRRDPTAAAAQDGGASLLAGTHLRARIALEPFGVTWEQRDGAGAWQCCCGDRDESYAYGVSERSGTLRPLAGARRARPLLRPRRQDRPARPGAAGACARARSTRWATTRRRGDPLYKHWPFFLGRRADTGAAYGVYYDTLAECSFDFGAEHDNYHGRYRATEIADGDLDAMSSPGPTLRDALARFVAAIGGTALPPRWTLGYANTAMGLDRRARRAGSASRDFLGNAERDGFPLSSFHFGSGYSSRGKQRYVFTWNHDKFPEPRELMAAFRERRRAHGGQPQALPARRPPGLRRGSPPKAPSSRDDGRALPRPVLGRLGRAPRLHARGRPRLVAARPAAADPRRRHRRRLERQQRVRDLGRDAPRTASASRCRCRARGRCSRC